MPGVIDARELPEGWEYLDEDESAGRMAEFLREVTPGHLLAEVPVAVFAASVGSDDVLFRHLNHPNRFTVVHLTWIGRQEIDAQHPWIEFDGTFEEFSEEQRRQIERALGKGGDQ